MRRLTIFLCALFAAGSAIAVNGQGVVLTPKDDYESIPTPAGPAPSPAAMSINIGIGAGFKDDYDLPAKMDLGEYLPPPGQQGKTNNCVAWAIAHAAYSCQIGQQRHQKPEHDCDIFSAAFLYEGLREGNDGLDPLKVIEFARKNGCASQASMPADAATTSTQAKAEAKIFRAIRHERPTNLEDIKTFIYEGYPVILVVYMDDGFRSDALNEKPYTWSKSKNHGLHAITAVGYDDSKQAIRIMNSWGTGWKDAGYCWVSYENLESINDDSWCPRAYVVKIKQSAPFNMRTGEERYQLRKDRRVYQRDEDEAVTLSEWKIDDAVCSSDSLFVLRRDQKLFRYNDDGSWTVLNDGVLKDETIAMMAADRFNPLHVLTDDGELFQYNERSGQWSQVSLTSGQPPEVVDIRGSDGEIYVTTSKGTVFVRDDDSWTLAP